MTQPSADASLTSKLIPVPPNDAAKQARLENLEKANRVKAEKKKTLDTLISMAQQQPMQMIAPVPLKPKRKRKDTPSSSSDESDTDTKQRSVKKKSAPSPRIAVEAAREGYGFLTRLFIFLGSTGALFITASIPHMAQTYWNQPQITSDLRVPHLREPRGRGAADGFYHGQSFLK